MSNQGPYRGYSKEKPRMTLETIFKKKIFNLKEISKRCDYCQEPTSHKRHEVYFIDDKNICAAMICPEIVLPAITQERNHPNTTAGVQKELKIT